MLRIGVISDTHGLLRPEAVERLRGSDHILHAGDIGAPGIVEALEKLAPVTAIRGNVDKGAWAGAYPTTETLRLGGLAVHMVHAIQDLDPGVGQADGQQPVGSPRRGHRRQRPPADVGPGPVHDPGIPLHGLHTVAHSQVLRVLLDVRRR